MAGSSGRVDLLLFHAWFLAHDPLEQELMRPFPPLGIQYLVAWLRANGFPDVDWWDASFTAGPECFSEELDRREPRVVGLYGHTVTRPTALPMVLPAAAVSAVFFSSLLKSKPFFAHAHLAYLRMDGCSVRELRAELRRIAAELRQNCARGVPPTRPSSR